MTIVDGERGWASEGGSHERDTIVVVGRDLLRERGGRSVHAGERSPALGKANEPAVPLKSRLCVDFALNYGFERIVSVFPLLS